MVGFSILNQTARDAVFTRAIEQSVGIQVMFAVRKALSQPDFLKSQIAELIEKGQIDANDIDDPDDPLGFTVHEAGAVNVTDEPGTHVILSGTGNPAHLEENFASFERPPLPEEDVNRLKHIFRNVDSITGQ